MHCVSLGEDLLYARQFLPMLLFTEYICYDDGCHLNKFCTNPIRKDLTGTTKKLALLPIMVDKVHIAGHVDAWCLENCDSRKAKDLEKVRAPFTSICTRIISMCRLIHRYVNKLSHGSHDMPKLREK